MAFQTTAEARDGYLYFKLTGDFEMNALATALDLLIGSMAENKSERVLIDILSVRGAPSTWERFQFATLFGARYLAARAKDSIPPGRFALVGQEPLVDPKRFGEKVAQNRGLPVKVFLSEPEALEWLRSS